MKISSSHKLPSGYTMPVLGYGTYETSPQETERVVSEALKAGYRLIDSAAFYNNEDGCGRAIAASGIPRSDIFFTSKLAPGKMGYEATTAAIAASLRASGLAYIDLYLIHAPFGDSAARNGSWRALAEAVHAGSLRSVGVSNYGLLHLQELQAFRQTLPAELAAVPISVAQYELHPWMRRRELAAFARETGMVLQAFGPLVVGKKAKDPTLAGVAAKHGKKWSQVLIRWSLEMGFVPLPKSVTAERIAENFDVFDFELDVADMQALDTDAYEVNRPQWDPVTWGLSTPAF